MTNSFVSTVRRLLVSGGLVWVATAAPLDPERGLPSGLRVNRVSAYAGILSFGFPNSAGQGTSNLFPGWLAAGGASTDIGLYAPGRTNQAFVEYHGGYNATARYPGLNGFDHILSFGVRMTPAPRLTLGLAGAAESTVITSFLFQASRNADLLGSNPMSGSQSDQMLSSGLDVAPPSLILLGMSRRSATLGMTLVFSQSPRLAWHGGVRGARHLPGASRGLAYESSGLYPSATEAISNVGVSYALSRRTRMGADLDYMRSYSSYGAYQLASGRLSIDREIGRRSFIHTEAGYGWLGEVRRRSDRPPLTTYRGAFGIGTQAKDNTFVLAVRREIGDHLGLGAANTLGGGLDWTWHRPNKVWTLEGSLAYERIAGRNVQLFQGWLYRSAVGRKITHETSLVLEGMYMQDSGSFTREFTRFARRAVRMSFVWTPGAVR